MFRRACLQLGHQAERALLDTAARGLGAALERAERQRELEARNAEAETFTYTVSHDLRAPLLAIAGMSELLGEAVRAGDAEEAEFLLGRVSANVERMGRLLSDLLVLSRAGRAAEPPEILDLGELVAASLSQLEGRLSARGVAVALPDAWPLVCYPRSELDQVLTNLLGNAVKFAGRPGQPPRVALTWGSEGSTVTVRVSDNGPGVAPPYRDKVFGLFQRLDPEAEGTGVGLAIVRRIAERHGGRVWVEDSPPPPEGLGGATFAASLPLA